MSKEGAGPYDDLLAEEVEKELAKRKIEIPEGSGSGKNGRILKADMIAALEADDGVEVLEDEAGDAAEPMEVEGAEVEPVEAKAAKPNGVIEPTKDEAAVKIGDLVSYRDKFNGATQDARVSGIVDEGAGVVDLAVFAGGGTASRREAVPKGRGAGQWQPKGAA